MYGQKMFIVFDLLFMYVIIVFGCWLVSLGICILYLLLIMCWKLCIIIGYGCGFVIVLMMQNVFLMFVIQLCIVLFSVFFSVCEFDLIGMMVVLSSFIWQMLVVCWCMFFEFMQMMYFILKCVQIVVVVILCWLVLVFVIMCFLFMCFVSSVWLIMLLILCVFVWFRFLCFRQICVLLSILFQCCV